MKVDFVMVRKYLSRKYLDLAERGYLSNFDRVQELKRIRESQHEDAEETYLRTRPPTGARLVPLSTRIIELYRIEEFHRFYKRLLSFLPELSNPVSLAILESLRDFNKGEGRQWINLGVISREPMLGMVTRFDPNLPEAIYYIDLHLNRVLPSIFILAIDVFFSDSHLKALEDLQSQRYLPEVILYDLFLHGMFVPHSTGNPEQAMSSVIAKWEAGLRQFIVTYFKPILFGFFSASTEPKYGDLPFIDVWALQGTPQERGDYSSWEEHHSRWLESVGLYSYGRRYQNDEFILEYPVSSIWSSKEQVMRQGRLIILERQFAKLYKGDERSEHLPFIMHRDSTNVLDDLLVFTSVGAFIEQTNETLNQFRDLIFERFRSRRNINSLIKLHQEISGQRSLADLILRELDFHNERLGRDHSRILTQLRYIPRREGSNDILLIDQVRSDIKHHLKRLQEKYQAVELELNNFVTLQSIVQNHRLQVTAILISIFALLVALFEPQIASLINSLSK